MLPSPISSSSSFASFSGCDSMSVSLYTAVFHLLQLFFGCWRVWLMRQSISIVMAIQILVKVFHCPHNCKCLKFCVLGRQSSTCIRDWVTLSIFLDPKKNCSQTLYTHICLMHKILGEISTGPLTSFFFNQLKETCPLRWNVISGKIMQWFCNSSKIWHKFPVEWCHSKKLFHSLNIIWSNELSNSGYPFWVWF